MQLRGRSFGLQLALVVVGAAILRAAYLFLIARSTKGYGDWTFFHNQANLIAGGRGFIDPFALAEGRSEPSANHPPLYPLMLSALSALGATSELWHRSAGILLGGATVGLVGLLGRRVGGASVGLAAAALCAVHPTLIAADGALLSETLYGPLVAAMLLAAYAVLDRPDVFRACLLGALVGLATLARSEAILFLALLAGPVAWRAARAWRPRALVAVASAAASLMVISPWVIRNWSAFGRPTLSTNEGAVIAGANCPATYHGIDTGGWVLSCISPRRRTDELAQANLWRREGLDYARDHAGRLPVVAVVRLLRVWDLYQPRRQVLFAEGRQIRAVQAGVAVWYLIAALAVGGTVLLARRRQTLVVLAAPFLVVTVTAVLGYGVPRLRHSADLAAVVLASVALPGAVERLRERRRPRRRTGRVGPTAEPTRQARQAGPTGQARQAGPVPAS